MVTTGYMWLFKVKLVKIKYNLNSHMYSVVSQHLVSPHMYTHGEDILSKTNSSHVFARIQVIIIISFGI